MPKKSTSSKTKKENSKKENSNFKSKEINNSPEIDEKKNIQNDKVIEEFCNSDSLVKPTATSTRTIVISIIVAVIFGLASGFISILLFLSGAISTSPIFSWVDVESLLPTVQVVVEKKEEITVLPDERLFDVLESTNPAAVSIFQYKKSVTDVQIDTYTAKDFLGNGLVLTNDGWVVTTNDVISGQGEYVISTQAGQIYPVSEIRSDNDLGLFFLKVKDANLHTVSLANLADLKLAEKILVLSGVDKFNFNLAISEIANKDLLISSKLIHNTEDNYLFILLSDSLGEEFLGSPAFNFNKEAIGIVSNYSGQNYVIPADYLRLSLTRILSKSDLGKAYLGLEYINLASALNPDFETNGALVINIKKNSPLVDLDIKIGDIITKVNGQHINGTYNLTNLVQEHKAGDNLDLTLLDKDDTNEKIISVKLIETP